MCNRLEKLGYFCSEPPLRRKLAGLFGTVICVLGAPSALSQDASDPTADAIKLQTEQTKAETEHIKARTARMQAQIDALNLPETKGETTLGGDAGAVEGWMLSSRAIELAAMQINERVLQQSGTKSVMILGGDDTLDFGGALRATHELVNQAQILDNIIVVHCQARVPSDGKSEALPIALAASAAMSLLRSDTSITAFSIEDAQSALINSIPGGEGNWVIPADLVFLGETSSIISLFQEVLSMRRQVSQCRRELSDAAQSDAAKAKIKPTLTKIDGAIARADAVITRMTAPKEQGGTELYAAAVAENALDQMKGSLLLRVFVEKAGGSLLNRKNLFTALGAPAVSVTGGLVVSWRLVDPNVGAVSDSGLIVCRTSLTNLRGVHKGKARAPSCDWDE